MIRIDRVCVWLLIGCLAFLTPSFIVFGFADEIFSALFGIIAFFDCIVNHNWKKYKLLWIMMAVLTLYAVYSTTLGFNTISSIIIDWVICLKPYIPFMVLYAVAPTLTETDKKTLRVISIINLAFSSAVLCGGTTVLKAVLSQPYVPGVIIYISACVYLYASIDSYDKIPYRNLIITIVFLSFGLLCTRSKFYAEYIVTLFFLFIYKPGITKHITLGHVTVIAGLCVTVLLATWQKISYYFLMGNNTTFDAETLQSFARPVLYATSGLILWDFFPFGSGLASFATFASQVNYSNLYYEYGLDKIHGLSPQMNDFICDAYYPSLAEFGIVGVILFIWLWSYIYGIIKKLLRARMPEKSMDYVIGSLLILFILIECTSGTTITQSPGVIAAALLGLICGKAEKISTSEPAKSSSLKNNKLICKKI
ncbi:MAG: hypothetical protein NC338_02940 [Firmicutes bacterium]|nr:hypothetical protein [Bacillota bacterium]MCM1401232.1 hypothetical protein [Bacteroides sp.]MCM1477219.1 hypothetical protein [Bacteroides sp.]